MSGSRVRRRGPGSWPLTEKREQFVALIARGLGTGEASRIVGVDRHTGIRWRYGRTVKTRDGRVREYPSVISSPKPPLSGRYLSADDRLRIADLHREEKGIRAIADEVGRAPSTISRELRRNVAADGKYRPHGAHVQACKRQARPRDRRITVDAGLCEQVQSWLDLRWSPEQIAHELRARHPDRPRWHLSVESIYQAIYDPAAPLGRDAHTRLRRRRRRRRPHRRGDQRRGTLVGMTMISQRPIEANDRRVPGHWEGDTISGKVNKTAIGTVVERTSRFLLLGHSYGQRSSRAVGDGVIDAFDEVPPHLRRSLTWDQGKEMAEHQRLSQVLDMPVFFCEPHSPWQRGSNENMNGLVRDYFPKGTDLSRHSAAELKRVQDEINDRPRKCLNWQTPAQVFAALKSQHS